MSDNELERRFSDMAEVASDWFWETDEQLRFTYFSERVFEATGIHPEFHYGKTRRELAPTDDDPDVWERHLRDMEERRPFKNFVFRRAGPDGTMQWIRTSGIPYYDDDGCFRGYRGSASNVTKEVEMREAAHRSERRFQDIAESSFDRFWETDRAHRFTYFSPADNMETHIPPSSLLGKTRWESNVIPAKDDDHWREHLRTLEARQPFRDFEFSRVDRTGRIRHISINGVPVFDEFGRFEGYRGTASDITTRIESGRALSAATANLAAAVESLSEAFVFWDNEDRLVVCNQQFRTINEAVSETTVPGTRFEDHIRATLEKGLVPDAIGREDEYLRNRLSLHHNPGPPRELQQGDRWLRVSEQKANGRGTVTVSVDITEQKNAELALRRAYDQLDRLVEERTAALRDSQALLETVIDAAPMVISAKNRDLRYT
ncbi:MAG: PAS domain S-box protein, partial [Gammaproteobacteria bacterium]|nr:PAS domain S-box protein [Gammaproteobacteria bacterium]